MSPENRKGSTGAARRPAEGRSRTSPAQVANRAAAELAELLGRPPESIVSLDRTDDGWRVGIEVLETRRIPDTSDVLAEYEVDTDRDGELVGYRRVRRYNRGRVGEER